MYLQSRTKRWLQVVRNSETRLRKALEGIDFYTSRAHVPGARQISERDTRVSLLGPLDQMVMTRESQPLAPGSWLAEALVDVTTAMDNIVYDDGFAASVQSLLSAIESAIPILEEQATEPDASADEIIADLERALLISLVPTLTAHNGLLRAEGEWSGQHQRFLQGHLETDLGHYLAVRTFGFVDEPGPGRVHMQHVVSACDAGMTLFVAGAGHANVEHYPEIRAITYAQWFTYVFAIWEEQFRGRLAKFWDSQMDEKIRRSDVLVDYFGDIRLIRNDFVHNKGICEYSANAVVLQWNFVADQPIEITTDQMISLIGLFPYDDLRRPPTPQPSSGLKSAPGRIDAHLLEDVKDRARQLGLSENELADAAFSQWLEATTAHHPL